MKDWVKVHPKDVRVGNVIAHGDKTYEVRTVKLSLNGAWIYGTKNGPDLTPTNPEEVEVYR